MTRIQVACYCLLASAFVLTGILFTRMDVTPQAQAEMVVTRDNFTFMTARTADSTEAIFLLDNLNQKLLVYDADIARKEVRFSTVLDLARPTASPSGGRRAR